MAQTLPLQVAINDLNDAQTIVQAELQTYTIQPTESEQMMQIVIFAVMFVGAALYFAREVKPFLAQYAQVRMTRSRSDANERWNLKGNVDSTCYRPCTGY